MRINKYIFVFLFILSVFIYGQDTKKVIINSNIIYYIEYDFNTHELTVALKNGNIETKKVKRYIFNDFRRAINPDTYYKITWIRL